MVLHKQVWACKVGLFEPDFCLASLVSCLVESLLIVEESGDVVSILSGKPLKKIKPSASGASSVGENGEN